MLPVGHPFVLDQIRDVFGGWTSYLTSTPAGANGIHYAVETRDDIHYEVKWVVLPPGDRHLWLLRGGHGHPNHQLD